VLVEGAPRLAVDLEHAPGAPVDLDRHVQHRDDAVVAENRRDAVLGIVRQVLDGDRSGGLHRPSRRRGIVERERRKADDARLPADAGDEQEVALVGAIAHHLGVPDMGHARDLGGHIVQQPLGRQGLGGGAPEGCQRALKVHDARKRLGRVCFVLFWHQTIPNVT
jgi:hypothetical protein